VDSAKGEGISPAAAAVVAGVAGLAVGAGAMALRGMDGKLESDRDSDQGGEAP
jgi:hydrogenase small subunit